MLDWGTIVPSFGEARRAPPTFSPSIGRAITFQSRPSDARSTPPSALQWLGEDDAFQRLQHDARRLMALQATLAKVTGGLDVRAVRLDGTTLCVTVTGPSMAARLRQIEPLAIATLRQQGPRARRKPPSRPAQATRCCGGGFAIASPAARGVAPPIGRTEARSGDEPVEGPWGWVGSGRRFETNLSPSLRLRQQRTQ